jgi:alanyl aminopeptidase
MKHTIPLLFAACMVCAATNVPGAETAAPAATAAPDAPGAPTVRLTAGASPTRYALTLTVVPGAARVAGDIVIDLTLDGPHALLWLNAAALNVTGASTELPATAVRVVPGNDQFVGLAFDPPLPAGQHRLSVSFDAEQAMNGVGGVFALKDQGDWYALTQFESIAARHAFPCFDEPGFKTPWQLTLRVPRDLVAVSNTPIESETADSDMKTVRFQETRPLPSYLVAFAVGPWETVDLGKVGQGATPMRIIVPRGRRADATFVARAYPELFARLEHYFGVPYAYAKLDHVAIPINVGFAMENAGMITYGASILLAKPDAITPKYRRDAVETGTHEMAHQWFGNLVTTAWWDDIWLNEAFATWMSEKIVNEWNAGYERGAARIEERATAIETDSLQSARQVRQAIDTVGDIDNAFDSITYEKGATVIGMFEGWVGPEHFQQGVHNYLESKSYGTATANDFLAALGAASQLPVAPAFDTFLNQNGVPRVEMRLQCDARGARLQLSQQRLTPIGSEAVKRQQWQIPVCARYGTAAQSHQACTLMTQPTQALALPGGCPDYVFGNAGGRGYYVPDYRGKLLDDLARHRTALTAPEYASLLYDMRALVQAGSLTADAALQWVRMAANAPDRHVVDAALELATFIGNTVVTDDRQPQFSAYVREVFGPRARTLGFVPKPGESDDDQLLRRSMLALVAPRDPALAAQARQLTVAWIKDRQALDPGLVDVVLVAAAKTGDAQLFDAMLAESRATQDRLDRRNLFTALYSFTDPSLAQRGMQLLLDPTLDKRETWTSVRYARHWSPASHTYNNFVMANFDALAKTVPADRPGGWPGYGDGLCTSADREQLAAFWKDRAALYPGAERNLAHALEAIQVCTSVRWTNQHLATGH